MRYILVFVLPLFLLAGCSKSSETNYTGSGQVQFEFSHQVGQKRLVLDTLLYLTTTNHHYKVADLQYFVSDFILYRQGGKPVRILSGQGIHYVDVRVPVTLAWAPADGIGSGTYDSVSFTFGISAGKNISNTFPNPPERDMAWPDILGGGYHYMKMNLEYTGQAASGLKPFMFHLGIGQLYSTASPNPDSITGYVQNDFRVTIPARFTVVPGKVCRIGFTMQVDRWFDGPETFDFDDYPGGIMQFQEGMHKACLNGRHAFFLTAGK
ncbi:MAG: MbnP family protein [Bacteroidota bacterium]